MALFHLLSKPSRSVGAARPTPEHAWPLCLRHFFRHMLGMSRESGMFWGRSATSPQRAGPLPGRLDGWCVWQPRGRRSLMLCGARRVRAEVLARRQLRPEPGLFEGALRGRTPRGRMTCVARRWRAVAAGWGGGRVSAGGGGGGRSAPDLRAIAPPTGGRGSGRSSLVSIHAPAKRKGVGGTENKLWDKSAKTSAKDTSFDRFLRARSPRGPADDASCVCGSGRVTGARCSW